MLTKDGHLANRAFEAMQSAACATWATVTVASNAAAVRPPCFPPRHPKCRPLISPVPLHTSNETSLLRTWHIHRAVLVCCAPYAQLAVAVPAPALDASPTSDGTRVAFAQGDGDGRESCREKSKSVVSVGSDGAAHSTCLASPLCML